MTSYYPCLCYCLLKRLLDLGLMTLISGYDDSHMLLYKNVLKKKNTEFGLPERRIYELN